MTFDQYIENPMGKSNAVFAARHAYKAEYTEKFDALFMREAGKIDYALYYDKPHDTYYAHIKIPSEKVKKFYYDVVIRFFTNDNALRTSASLKDYQVQFFSNDPAFIYTYLYVFNKLGMLVEDLKSKCPKASLTLKPEERNIYEVPGYVKSIYFAYILMSRINLFTKATYHHFGRKYSKSALLGNVASGEQKMEERKTAEAKQKKVEKDKKTNVKRVNDFNTRSAKTNNSNRIRTVKKVGSVNQTRTISRVSNTGRKSK